MSTLILLQDMNETDKRVDYEETDSKVLLHNLNELEKKDYERNKELRDYELKS